MNFGRAFQKQSYLFVTPNNNSKILKFSKSKKKIKLLDDKIFIIIGLFSKKKL